MTPTTPRAAAPSTPLNLDGDAGSHDTNMASGCVSMALPGQLPLPTSSFAPSPSVNTQGIGTHPEALQISIQSSGAVDEMEVDVSDDGQDDSDNETENGEPGRVSKNKKGQRFFCTDFPPCNLSFTRSEHLARHIRKHTGERPFQCHCNRRFSRLDNLRQHAQTVHVNEEIPGDSLAATGTRFQRQIRTDRVRPVTSRPRTSTVGSNGSHNRGHSRNLSSSSMGSNASNYSTAAETRRRPPPLLMASDVSARPKLTLDPPVTPPAQYRGFRSDSPGGTCTSANCSGVTGSPYGSTLESPLSSTSRNGSFCTPRTPNRRLSVPSGANPFQAPHNPSSLQPYMSPYGLSSYSNQSSAYASPTTSVCSYVRIDPNLHSSEDWRRRTWHPSSYTGPGVNYARPATSGLSFSQTPDGLQPVFSQDARSGSAQLQAPRLPGIESFDQVQHRPYTPPRMQPSTISSHTTPQPPVFATPQPTIRNHLPESEHRRARLSWDPSLHAGLLTLDSPNNDQRDTTSWGQQTINEIQDVASRPVMTCIEEPAAYRGAPAATQGHPTTSPRNKRNGWYSGPHTTVRKSPEDSSSSDGLPTPGIPTSEMHPAIMHSNGYIEPHNVVLNADGSANVSRQAITSSRFADHFKPCGPPRAGISVQSIRQDDMPRPSFYPRQSSGSNDMGRLEALVAVATSEEKAATPVR